MGELECKGQFRRGAVAPETVLEWHPNWESKARGRAGYMGWVVPSVAQSKGYQPPLRLLRIADHPILLHTNFVTTSRVPDERHSGKLKPRMELMT